MSFPSVQSVNFCVMEFPKPQPFLQTPLINYKPHFSFLQFATPPISACISTDNNKAFTISYLMNSCGLSDDEAISSSNKIHLQNSSQPDSILALFRNHEFSDTQISKFIHKYPPILLSNPDKNLIPKFQFFNSIGISGPILAHILSRNPQILCQSLERKIKPVIAFLQGLGLTQTDFIKLITRSSWVLSQHPQTRLAPGIALLQTHGVPDYYISKLLVKNANTVLNTERLAEIVEEIIQLQIDPCKASFIEAITVKSGLTKSSWDAKCGVYNRWGWSEDDIHIAFRKHPVCMAFSEKKVMSTMEYYVDTMGYDALVFARCPWLLDYSLEKRIIPRISVVKVLIANGLLGNKFNLMNALSPTEDEFLEKFVTKFVKEVPGLSNAYLDKLK